jgi:membrane dipeptidase
VIPRGGVFDAHVDSILAVRSPEGLLAGSGTHLDLARARDAGVTDLVLAICAEAAKEPREALDRGLRIFGGLPVDGIPRLHLALEGCEPIASGWLSDEDVKKLSIATLSWNGANSVAGGIGSDVGLTPTGRRLAERLYSLGIAIDVSHLCDRARREVLDTGLPVVATHSNCRALCDTPRNLPDDDIKQIGATGGVVGITLVPAFIGPDADLSSVADHLEHAVSIAGICHVGMGSDFDGVSELPRGIRDCTFWPDFFDLLEGRGWRAGEIELIAGGNWRKLLSGRRVK